MHPKEQIDFYVLLDLELDPRGHKPLRGLLSLLLMLAPIENLKLAMVLDLEGMQVHPGGIT